MKKIGPILLLLVSGLIYLYPYVFDGRASFFRVHDNAESCYAYLAASVRDHLLHGSFSWWYPYAGSGIDALSVTMHSPLSAIYQLFLFFKDPWISSVAVVCLQIAGALSGAYLLLLRAFRLPPLVASAGALLWVLRDFSPNQFTTFDVFGAPWLPLHLWILHLLLRRRTRLQLVLGAIALGLCLGATSTIFLYPIYFLGSTFLFFLFFERRSLRELLLAYGLIGVSTLLIKAPEILTILLNLKESSRIDAAPPEVLGVIGGFASSIADSVLKDKFLFAGASAAAFAGGRSSAQWRSLLWFTIGLFLTSKVLWALALLLRPYAGFLGAVNYADLWILGRLLLVVLVVLGFSTVTLPRVRMAGLVAICLCALGAQVFIARQLVRRAQHENYARYFENPLLRKLAQLNPERRRVLVWDAQQASAYAPNPGWLLPGMLGPYGLSTIGGYFSLYPRAYREFWLSLFQDEPRYLTRFLRKPIWLYVFEDAALRAVTPEFSDRLAAADVGYIVAARPLNAPGWLEVHSSSEGHIYHRPGPRGLGAFSDECQGQSVDVERGQDELVVRYVTNCPATLKVSESYSRFWTAELDGKKIQLNRSGAFMAVPTAKGAGTLRLTYQPPYAWNL